MEEGRSNGARSERAWQPGVTALMPCYNAADFLSRTLDSLAAQSWPNLEILIGDDCSTDDTLAIISAFAEGRDNVRVITREQNLGWLRNSNDLMAKAAGELMFFAFHDDLIAPTYVEKLVEALDQNPRAVLAYSDMEVFEVDGTRQVWIFDEIAGVRGRLARGYVMARRRRGWWVPNRGLFRGWAFKRIGGIKPNAQGEFSADWTWLLHMALLGEFVRVPELLCQKFYKTGSLSKAWPRDAMRRRALRRAGIREIRGSELGPAQKAFLIAYLALRELRDAVVAYLPPGVKALVRRAIRLPR